jgi:hypothetical protein
MYNGVGICHECPRSKIPVRNRAESGMRELTDSQCAIERDQFRPARRAFITLFSVGLQSPLARPASPHVTPILKLITCYSHFGACRFTSNVRTPGRHRSLPIRISRIQTTCDAAREQLALGSIRLMFSVPEHRHESIEECTNWTFTITDIRTTINLPISSIFVCSSYLPCHTAGHACILSCVGRSHCIVAGRRAAK